MAEITKMPRSCEAAHEVSKVEAQRGERYITYLLVTDPWSKGDYSRYIREASMAMDGLPEGVPPSGRVPKQLLQEAPILKRRRRRYRGEFARKRSILGVSTPRAKYRRRGCPGDPPGSQEASGWWPPSATLVIPEASGSLIFYLIFQDFWSTFNGRKT